MGRGTLARMAAPTDVLATALTATTEPSDPGAPSVALSYVGRSLLKNRRVDRYTLASDSPVTVPLGSLAAVHVLGVRATGGSKVLLGLSSADAGSPQVLPANGLLWLEGSSTGAPLTGLTLTRSAGVEETVELFLGELA